MLLAKSTSRREMPPVSMMLPASMKKGMAASGNLLMEENISFTEINILTLLIWIPRMAASPMETATEMVRAKHSTMVSSMAVLIAHSPAHGVGDPGDCLERQQR